jgi:hypothetical protein
MPEGIDEPSLAMEPPRREVIPDLVPAAVRPGVHRTSDEGVVLRRRLQKSAELFDG